MSAIKEIPDLTVMNMPQAFALGSAIKRALTFTYKSNPSARYQSTICLRNADVVSTDGFRLYREEIEPYSALYWDGNCGGYDREPRPDWAIGIDDAKRFAEELCTGAGGVLAYVQTQTGFRLEIGSASATIRTERFPDYHRIIPSDTTVTQIVQAKPLAKAAAAICKAWKGARKANATCAKCLVVESGQSCLSFWFQKTSGEKVSESVSFAGDSDGYIRIGITAENLAGLRALDTGGGMRAPATVRIHFKQPLTALLLDSGYPVSRWLVIMPYRLD